MKIAFGTDAAVYPHGDNAKEFAVLAVCDARGQGREEAISDIPLDFINFMAGRLLGLISAYAAEQNANRYEFSPGTADLSALLSAAQNCPLAPGVTDPGICCAGHRVPATDPTSC